ncbi:MAG: DUF2750 domain-containing protein [Saccharospirillum sp.]|nr:DUF2750 domain-containing protein [Saccharospirillum sp.]
MTDKLNAVERDRIEQLNAEERYDYALQRMVELKQVWSLRDAEGGVLMSTDDEECMPIWPDEDFAKTWLTDDWADCEAFAISLDAWLQRWLPGMQTDEINVVVFPGPDEDGLILRPKTLREALQAIRDAE